jgi:hypothetical protein
VTDRRRWLVPVSAVLIAITPLLLATVRPLQRGWIAIGDNGLILMRAHDVGTRNHPLLGTWTSASLVAGRNINNPGPLWFDVLAPFVRLGGPNVGLAIGVMVANMAAIAGAAWAAHRVGGQRALVIVCALSAGLAWSMGSELLFDAWQPHAMILPFWALLVMCWGLGAGDLLMAPFVVGIASLLVQTHLSFVYAVAVVGGAAVALAAVGHRWPTSFGAGSTRPARLDRTGLATAIVLVAAWIQPLINQVAGEGNLANLLATSRSETDKLGAGLGVRIAASVLALPPWWGRPGFSAIVPPTPRGQAMDTSHIAGPVAATLGLLGLFAVLVAVVVIGRRRRSRSVLVLGTLAVAAAASGLLSMVLIPIGPIGVSPHQMRWLWPLSAFVILAPLVAVAEWPPARRFVVPLGLAATVALSVLNLPTYAAPQGPTKDRDATTTTMALLDQLSSYRPDGPVVFDMTGLRFAEPYSGAVLPNWPATVSTSS